MLHPTQSKWLLACGILCVTGSQSAFAGPPAPHPAVSMPHPAMSMPHPAMPAPRPAMPMARPMAAPRPAMPAPRAPMASAGRPMASQGHYAAPSHYAAAGHGTTAHIAAGHEHFDTHGGHTGEMSHGGVGHVPDHHDLARGDSHAADHAGSEHRGAEHHELARDDPARARDHFDEHVHNPERERDIVRLHEHDFHVRDVRHFNDREFAAWRDGYWHRDYYDGRFGWWYDVDGIYYPYASPFYPYPLVVASLVAEDVAFAAPPPPQVAGIEPLPALPNVAYHCNGPAGFYPTVDTCNAGWVALAAH